MAPLWEEVEWLEELVVPGPPPPPPPEVDGGRLLEEDTEILCGASLGLSQSPPQQPPERGSVPLILSG